MSMAYSTYSRFEPSYVLPEVSVHGPKPSNLLRTSSSTNLIPRSPPLHTSPPLKPMKVSLQPSPSPPPTVLIPLPKTTSRLGSINHEYRMPRQPKPMVNARPLPIGSFGSSPYLSRQLRLEEDRINSEVRNSHFRDARNSDAAAIGIAQYKKRKEQSEQKKSRRERVRGRVEMDRRHWTEGASVGASASPSLLANHRDKQTPRRGRKEGGRKVDEKRQGVLSLLGERDMTVPARDYPLIPGEEDWTTPSQNTPENDTEVHSCVHSERTTKICVPYTISEDMSGDRKNKILSRISEKKRHSGEVRFRMRSSYADRLGLRDNNNGAASSNFVHYPLSPAHQRPATAVTSPETTVPDSMLGLTNEEMDQLWSRPTRSRISSPSVTAPSNAATDPKNTVAEISEKPKTFLDKWAAPPPRPTRILPDPGPDTNRLEHEARARERLSTVGREIRTPTGAGRKRSRKEYIGEEFRDEESDDDQHPEGSERVQCAQQ